MARLASLTVADPAGLWAELGFSVVSGSVVSGSVGGGSVVSGSVGGGGVGGGGGVVDVGGTVIALGAPGSGIVGWRLEGAPSDIDGLPSGPAPEAPTRDGSPHGGSPTGGHRNGVVAVDHVVVATPDLDRTLGALGAAGLDLRRTRSIGGGEEGQPRLQAFYMLDRTVLEVVGPAGGAAQGPAHFWGVTFTVADLDATVAFLGDRIGVARDAVQPGRRIATLRRHAGSTVPMAFMSPHRRD